MDPSETDLCPAPALSEALEAVGADDERGLERIDALAIRHPADPRLHFLRGSVLAGLKRYEEALPAMRRAVAIAPGFALARFQLGLLELSSGNPSAAEATWGPLDTLAADDPLRMFAAGLRHLIRDEFAETVRLLREGIALNRDNPPLNHDMRLLAEQAQAKLDESERTDEPMSLTHLALQQYSVKPTTH